MMRISRCSDRIAKRYTGAGYVFGFSTSFASFEVFGCSTITPLVRRPVTLVVMRLTMIVLIAIAFLVALGIILWSRYALVISGKAGIAAKYIYIAVSAILALMAIWTTFFYEYFLNENTRVRGWPVPVVIFQRDDANSPWLDFVGPTVLLGLPMNFIIFMFIPSLVFLIVAYVRSKRSEKTPGA